MSKINVKDLANEIGDFATAVKVEADRARRAHELVKGQLTHDEASFKAIAAIKVSMASAAIRCATDLLRGLEENSK